MYSTELGFRGFKQNNSGSVYCYSTYNISISCRKGQLTCFCFIRILHFFAEEFFVYILKYWKLHIFFKKFVFGRESFCFFCFVLALSYFFGKTKMADTSMVESSSNSTSPAINRKSMSPFLILGKRSVLLYYSDIY